MSETAAQPTLDPRIAIALGGLHISTDLSMRAGEPITHESLAASLQWDSSLNAAVLPTGETNAAGEGLFHLLVAHSTYADTELIEPQLSFAERPEKYQTMVGNVYGTGLYTANRREAALRVREKAQGRQLGAYLTDAIAHSEIIDSRRRFLGDVVHLVGRTAIEMVAARTLGERRVARTIADRFDLAMHEGGLKLRLLNEAPRGRLEKMQHEEQWNYAMLPPQYLLSRVPMVRIGTYERPPEEPQRFSVVAMYGKRFWQAAWRNGRDMKHLGVKLFNRGVRPQATSKD